MQKWFPYFERLWSSKALLHKRWDTHTWSFADKKGITPDEQTTSFVRRFIYFISILVLCVSHLFAHKLKSIFPVSGFNFHFVILLISEEGMLIVSKTFKWFYVFVVCQKWIKFVYYGCWLYGYLNRPLQSLNIYIYIY